MARTRIPNKENFGESGFRFRRYKGSKTAFSVRVRMEPDSSHEKRWWSAGRKIEIEHEDDKSELLALAEDYRWELLHPGEVKEREDAAALTVSGYLASWREYRQGRLKRDEIKPETIERENPSTGCGWPCGSPG